jgi:hypothetical integral membrane protein (TIGR02206 family)
VQAGQPEFESFGVQHALTVLTVGGLIAGMCWMGRMLRGTTAGRRYEIALATCVWILWISYQVYDYVKYGFEPGNTLPLQMCDFSAVFAALVFVRPGRGLQSLAYFWGLALGSQAVITPDMAGGPGSIAFYWFWLYHVFIVGAGVYVVVVQGFPVGDLRFAVLMASCRRRDLHDQRDLRPELRVRRPRDAHAPDADRRAGTVAAPGRHGAWQRDDALLPG